MVCLTGLLMLSGGPSNPFTLLYLVHITLAATILTKRQTWLLGGLSVLCFALLFWIFSPVPELVLHHSPNGVDLHLIGMWISFTVAVLLVALYSARISSLLREHELSLLRMQQELARKDRLASLVTLAAGAAHELNTPLGTIAIVARELERLGSSTSPHGGIAEDSRLIRREVERCREILQRMSAHGAEPTGEAVQPVDITELLSAVRAQFTAEDIRVDVPPEPLPGIVIPRHAVQQALVALVRNGFEASSPMSPVTVSVRSAGGFVRFSIEDHGHGMSYETLRRVGEPFFTTKEPGKGMGLGLFLARTLAERLGGRLSFQSSAGTGTVALFELPVSLVPLPVDAQGAVCA
jgi:two-component system sensor histidine kinase RegB